MAGIFSPYGVPSKLSSSIRSAQGDLLTVDPIAITQVSAEYGYPNSMLIGELGGTVSVSNGLFEVSTGTGSANVAAAISSRESNQRPGQGLSCIISAMFTSGTANSTQQAGFISSESSYSFGFNGAEFGVLEAYDGVQEYQQLEVTTPASGAESATVTIDGVAHLIPLTASTVEQNAYEIAKFLEANELRYRATSNQATVTILAILPDFGGGLFSFSSSTAVASFTQLASGALPIESWTPSSSWSENKNFPIVPTKINDYKIQIDGNIAFYIKNTDTLEYELVHLIKRLNTATGVNVKNNTMRVGWGVRNTGNTSDIVVKGAYTSSFNEGYIEINTIPFSSTNTQAGVDAAGVGEIGTNVLALRSRTVYQGVPNRAEILPKILSFGTTSTKTAIFDIVANPTVSSGDLLDWGYLDQSTSIMEFATNNVQITGGQVVASFSVTSGGQIFDIDKLIPYQVPFSYFAIAARLTPSGGGSPADMTVNATWLEDK